MLWALACTTGGNPDAAAGSHDTGAETGAAEEDDTDDTAPTDTGSSDTADTGLTNPADADGDGFMNPEAGGEDCNDADPATYPGAPDDCGDGVDHDCAVNPDCRWAGETVAGEGALYSVHGTTYLDYVGSSLLVVPDMNGDGLAEWAVGYDHSTDFDLVGGISIYFGGASAGGTELDADIVLTSDHFFLGYGLDWGDFDGDGVPEIVTDIRGGGGWDAAAGYWEYQGPGAQKLDDGLRLAWADGDATIDAGFSWRDPYGTGQALFGCPFSQWVDGDGHPGFVIFTTGVEETPVFDAAVQLHQYGGGYDPRAARDLGDLDGDGRSSLGVELAWAVDPTGADNGALAIYDEVPPGIGEITDWDRVMYGNADEHANGGWTMLPGGDTNGDGYADLLVADWTETSPNGTYRAGCVRLLLAPLADITWLLEPDTQLCGATESALLGYDGTAAGDVDGDGRNDLLIGEQTVGELGAGRLSLYYGPPAAGSWDSSEPAARWNGAYEKQGAYHPASGADLNGDGTDDFLLGAHGDDTLVEYGGAVFVYAGSGE